MSDLKTPTTDDIKSDENAEPHMTQMKNLNPILAKLSVSSAGKPSPAKKPGRSALKGCTERKPRQ
jgi:hypothetical protein